MDIRSLEERFNIADDLIDNILQGLGVKKEDIKRKPFGDTINYKGESLIFHNQMDYEHKPEEYPVEFGTIVSTYNFKNTQYNDLLKDIVSSIDKYPEKKLAIIYSQANEEVKRLKNLGVEITGKFPEGIYIGDSFITPMNMDLDKLTKADRVSVKFLIKILKLIDQETSLEGLRALQAIKCKHKGRIEDAIDEKSAYIQETYGNTLLYPVIAKKYNYCVPYTLALEYTYNSKKEKSPSICELSGEYFLDITADRVTCEIVDTKNIEECKDKNQLIMLYTKVNFPQRTYRGIKYESYTDSHISMILVDSEKKTVEYYEPKGYHEFSLVCKDCINRWIKERYRSFEILKTNMEVGLQCLTSEGSCFLINLLYFYLKVTNKRPVEEVVAMIKRNGELKELVYKFGCLLESIAEEKGISSFLENYTVYENEIHKISSEKKGSLEEKKKVWDLMRSGEVDKSIDLIKSSEYVSYRAIDLAKRAPLEKKYLEELSDDIIIKAANIYTMDNIMDAKIARNVLTYPSTNTFEQAVKDELLPIVKKILREKKISYSRIRRAYVDSPRKTEPTAKYLESILLRKIEKCNNEEDILLQSFKDIYLEQDIYIDSFGNCLSDDDIRGILLTQQNPSHPKSRQKLWKNREEFDELIKYFEEEDKIKAIELYFPTVLTKEVKDALLKYVEVFNDIGMVGCVLKADYRDEFGESLLALSHLRESIDSIPDQKDRNIFLSLSVPEKRNINVGKILKDCQETCIHGIGADLINIYLYHIRRLGESPVLLKSFIQTELKSVILYSYGQKGEYNIYLYRNDYPSSEILALNYMKYRNGLWSYEFQDIPKIMNEADLKIINKSLRNLERLDESYRTVLKYLEDIKVQQKLKELKSRTKEENPSVLLRMLQEEEEESRLKERQRRLKEEEERIQKEEEENQRRISKRIELDRIERQRIEEEYNKEQEYKKYLERELKKEEKAKEKQDELQKIKEERERELRIIREEKERRKRKIEEYDHFPTSDVKKKVSPLEKPKYLTEASQEFFSRALGEDGEKVLLGGEFKGFTSIENFKLMMDLVWKKNQNNSSYVIPDEKARIRGFYKSDGEGVTNLRSFPPWAVSLLNKELRSTIDRDYKKLSDENKQLFIDYFDRVDISILKSIPYIPAKKEIDIIFNPWWFYEVKKLKLVDSMLETKEPPSGKEDELIRLLQKQKQVLNYLLL